MSAPQPAGSALTREATLRALSSLSEELGKQGVTGELFLNRHLRLPSPREVLDLVGQYYPSNRIPMKTQYLVEGLFEEGRV